MSNNHEYLKDGVWYGKRPPDRFIGLVRHGKKEWEKTEVRELKPGIGGQNRGHECCDCPNCAAWHATVSHGILRPGPASPRVLARARQLTETLSDRASSDGRLFTEDVA